MNTKPNTITLGNEYFDTERASLAPKFNMDKLLQVNLLTQLQRLHQGHF